MNEFSCPKCAAAMVKGYVADHGNSGGIFKTLWFDGEAEHASLLGIKGTNISADRSKQKAIRGLRCTRCGYLELYAVQDPQL